VDCARGSQTAGGAAENYTETWQDLKQKQKVLSLIAGRKTFTPNSLGVFLYSFK